MTRVSGFLFAGAGVVLSLFIGVACSSSNTVAPAGTSSGATDDAGDTADAADESSSTTSSSSGGGGTQCTAARDSLLVPVASVSKGDVKVVSSVGGVMTIFVDATAGGDPTAYGKNPRTYITLADGARANITDKAATSSTAWDLALKRTTLYTNSGDAGPGVGGGVLVNKAFDAVTAADADAAKIAPESFFDANCKAKQDQNEDVITSFTGWYDYNESLHVVTPAANTTVIVKGATGARFKVAITSWSAKEDGTEGTTPGNFLLKVAPL